MANTLPIDAEEWASLQRRLSKLAADKSSLQLAVYLMEKLSAVSGLNETVDGMLRAVLEVIGGTRLLLYYWVDGQVYRADALGHRDPLEAIEDPLVLQVMRDRVLVEVDADFTETQMTTKRFAQAKTWVFPMLVGSELIGVFQMEGTPVAPSELKEALPTFFRHAALVLKNEIVGHSRLRKAYVELEKEVAVRKQAETELRIAKENLEAQVADRTAELLEANGRLVNELATRAQVQELLRDSEQHYRQLVEASPEGIAITDIAGRVLYVSAPASVMFGLPVPDVALGTSILDWIAPDSHPLVSERTKALFEGEVPVGLAEYQLRRADGSLFWGELVAKPLTDAQGRVTRLLLLIRDITERREAQQAMERNNRLLEGVSTGSLRLLTETELDQGVESVLQILGEAAEVDRACVFENRGGPGAETLRAELAYAYTRSKEAGLANGHEREPLPYLPLLAELYEGLANHRHVEVQASELSESLRLSLAAEGISSVLLVPIVIDGRFWGFIGFYDARPSRSWQKSEVATLWASGVAIGSTIVRQRMVRSLRESEQLQRAILGNIADPAWLKDAWGRYLAVNDAWCRFAGLTAEQAVGKEDSDFLPPEMAGRFQAEDRWVIETGQGLRHEEYVKSSDGGVHWYETAKTIVLGERGEPLCLVGIAHDISERKRAEELLKASEEKFSKAFQNSPVLMTITRLADGTFVEVNREFLRVSGFIEEDLIGKTSVEVGWLKQEQRQRILDALLAEGRVSGMLVTTYAKDGKALEITYDGERFEFNNETYLLSIGNDLTKSRMLEEQLRQAQKMEAIGRLAGGVAHDFNNILSAMLMHLSVLQRSPGLDLSTKESLRELAASAKRAAGLTRQLLLFSRRQAPVTRPIDLNDLLDNLLKMLRRLLGEDIRILFNSGKELPWVEADAGMIEQVGMNLAVNARDAMPEGGQLTITSEAVSITKAYVRSHPSARPGLFVRITFADTGCGMDPATLERVFEPFFTTKDVGQGTGLGLATVYGVVQQHQGWVEVSSTPQVGSEFRIYLPAQDRQKKEAALREEVYIPAGRGEMILLVEDEASLRRVTAVTLRSIGYEVLEAANGVEALLIWKEHKDKVDLVLTDMVMPEGLSGGELLRRLLQEKPTLRGILASGYSLDLNKERKQLLSEFPFLPKPFEASTLGEAVRKALDGKP